MEEEIVDILINRIKKIVITDKKMTLIPMAYLVTLDIPEAVKHFFDQEVEIWIREEEEKFTTNDRFNYDMPEVRMLIDQLFDRLKQNATFHITKFNQLLERAVKLEMNYLIEPHRTLSQFLFKDSQLISTMEVYDTLKYFSRYEYYKDAISDYFNLKYLREITQDQFNDLINQIDEKAFSEDRLETTLKTIKTIMDFWGEAKQQEVNSLPIDIFQAAFGDRDLSEYKDLIEQVKEKTELSELTFDELQQILRENDIAVLSSEKEETAAEPAETIDYEQIEDIEESRPEISVEEIEVKEAEIGDLVEEEEYEEEYEEEEEAAEISLAEETKEAEVEAEPETAPVPGKVAEDLADLVARQISSDSPLQDLNELIAGRIRRRSLKKLFKKNEDEYLGFINSLNILTTWKEASRLIDDEFYERGINPYSKEAITLSDVIYLRFFPKDKYVAVDDDIEKF